MIRLTLTAVALALASVSTPVLAGPPGGVPPGLAKKGVDRHEWQESREDRDRGDWRDRDRRDRETSRDRREDRERRDDRVSGFFDRFTDRRDGSLMPWQGEQYLDRRGE